MLSPEPPCLLLPIPEEHQVRQLHLLQEPQNVRLTLTCHHCASGHPSLPGHCNSLLAVSFSLWFCSYSPPSSASHWDLSRMQIRSPCSTVHPSVAPTAHGVKSELLSETCKALEVLGPHPPAPCSPHLALRLPTFARPWVTHRRPLLPIIPSFPYRPSSPHDSSQPCGAVTVPFPLQTCHGVAASRCVQRVTLFSSSSLCTW